MARASGLKLLSFVLCCVVMSGCAGQRFVNATDRTLVVETGSRHGFLKPSGLRTREVVVGSGEEAVIRWPRGSRSWLRVGSPDGPTEWIDGVIEAEVLRAEVRDGRVRLFKADRKGEPVTIYPLRSREVPAEEMREQRLREADRVARCHTGGQAASATDLAGFGV
ncbi:MAG: hypothetical protein JJU33_11625 [Phycisphaerales bacterium]|nr:hypothetical protein [Phycisphaerales bacterium]